MSQFQDYRQMYPASVDIGTAVGGNSCSSGRKLSNERLINVFKPSAYMGPTEGANGRATSPSSSQNNEKATHDYSYSKTSVKKSARVV